MKIIAKNAVFAVAIFLMSILLLPILNSGKINTVSAQESTSPICTIFPFLSSDNPFFGGICGDSSAAEGNVNNIISLVQIGLSLIFVGIILVAIFVIIKSAIKYIRSEGTPEKVEEAQKAIKQVFMGIGALFFGIIGIVLILVFFQVTGATSVDVDSDSGLQDNPILNPLIPD